MLIIRRPQGVNRTLGPVSTEMGDRVRVQFRCRTLISVCNQPATHDNSAFHPSGVGKWVPASAGKAKAGMVHSVSGWMRGVQVKLRDPLRTCAIPERLIGVFTTRHYANQRLPYLYLTYIWAQKPVIVMPGKRHKNTTYWKFCRTSKDTLPPGWGPFFLRLFLRCSSSLYASATFWSLSMKSSMSSKHLFNTS